jgi:uncharacterized protein (DUF1501 family)
MPFIRQALPSPELVYDQQDVLICIFQRGAADGLNSLVPYGDPEYLTKRPNIGVTTSIALSEGFYGLHPALAPLQAIYNAGDLALVHATGVPHDSRSHFDAQNLVEGGVVNKTELDEGWIGRHLASSQALTNSAFRAVSIAGNVAFSLTGADEPIAIEAIEGFGLGELTGTSYQELLSDWFEPGVPFSSTAQASIQAMDELLLANPGQFTPQNGVSYPQSELGNKLRQASQMVRSSLGTEVICVDVGGWDHHENLPFYLEASLTDLGNSLEAFYTDMGPTMMQKITVVVHTEFGRRVGENFSSGADHGTGGLAYLMGGGVNGSQVQPSAANWPGLADQDLYMGEDLAITTDLRSIFSELLIKRLGRTDVSDVFPDFTGPTDLSLFLN